MANCQKEFISHTSTAGCAVLCAQIFKGDPDYRDSVPYILQIGYNQDKAREFLDSLDFQYDSGYGGQEIYGTIWYTDGTWSDRGEYDGSEWWQHQVKPEIPEACKEAPSDV